MSLNRYSQYDKNADVNPRLLNTYFLEDKLKDARYNFINQLIPLYDKSTGYVEKIYLTTYYHHRYF